MSKNTAVNKILFEDESERIRQPYSRPKENVRKKLTAWDEPKRSLKVAGSDLSHAIKQEDIALGPLYSKRLKQARLMAFAGTFALVGLAAVISQALQSTDTVHKPAKSEVAASAEMTARKPSVPQYKNTPIRIPNNDAHPLGGVSVRATHGDLVDLRANWSDRIRAKRPQN